MDKKLKRQIIFKQTADGQKVPKQLQKANTATEPNNLYLWIKERPFLNLNGICNKIGIDRANFAKAMAANKPIKKEIRIKLIEELKQYGYAE